MIGLLWLGVAAAHLPAVGPQPGHTLRVDLAAGRVDLRYRLEVVEGTPEPALVVWANGVALPAEWRAEPAVAPEPGWVAAEWSARVTGVNPPAELRVENHTLPDQPALFLTAVTVDGGLVVESSTLARVRDGNLRDNVEGAWIRDPAARTLVVAYREAEAGERGATGALPNRMAGMLAATSGGNEGPAKSGSAAVGWAVGVAAAGAFACIRMATKRRLFRPDNTDNYTG